MRDRREEYREFREWCKYEKYKKKHEDDYEPEDDSIMSPEETLRLIVLFLDNKLYWIKLFQRHCKTTFHSTKIYKGMLSIYNYKNNK